MNDFTKDELKEMLFGLRYFYAAYHKGLIPNQDSSVSSGLLIINNLQYMIDNYCEHDMGYDAGEHTSCRKCGARE